MPKIRHLYSCYSDGREPWHNGLQLDIFLYGKQGTNLFPLSVDVHDSHSYPIDMIFPRDEMMFEGIRVYIPHQYKKYCKQNWKEYPPPYPSKNKRYPHEGTLKPNSICKHHYKLYPNLYKSISN